MCSFTAVIQLSANACCPTTQIHWVLGTRDSVSCLTRCLGEIREMIEIQSKVSVGIYLILNPKRVTSSHTALYMKHTGDAIVHAYAHKHTHAHTINDRACFGKPGGCIWTLDISHWPCDLVMQSPLIPTYDECMLEWSGGVMKQRYETSCMGGCPLCSLNEC